MVRALLDSLEKSLGRDFLVNLAKKPLKEAPPNIRSFFVAMATGKVVAAIRWAKGTLGKEKPLYVHRRFQASLLLWTPMRICYRLSSLAFFSVIVLIFRASTVPAPSSAPLPLSSESPHPAKSELPLVSGRWKLLRCPHHLQGPLSP